MTAVAMNITLPEIGSWFRGQDGTTFEVVAIDGDDQTIEIQHFDGTVEELDTESWRQMLIVPVDPPEDWSGSMDVDTEDLPDNEEPHRHYDDLLDFVDDYDDIDD